MALVAAGVGAVVAQAHLLRDDVVEGDALVHQYWMRSFTDPELFTDGLTAELRRSERYPDAYEALFRLASQVADPIAFGEWLGIALMGLAGWLVFAVVRELQPWPAAGWLAAALFLILDGHRFSGGFPRAFVHVVVLLTVLLALRRRTTAAALVAAGGVLVYPPAALLATGILILAARRAGLLALALGAAVVAVQMLADPGGGVLTAREARAYPEFGGRGPLHFFVPSTLEYLSQNRSGFNLRASGSILVLAAVGLLLARPANLRLLRREVLALPAVAVCAFALAQATLFRLYLPHRYTYPLVAFAAITIGVVLRPTWQAVLAQRRPRLHAFGLLLAAPTVAAFAVYAFPLGPRWSPGAVAEPAAIAGLAVAMVLAGAAALALGLLSPRAAAATGAAMTTAVLAAAILAPGRRGPGQRCADSAAARFLATLPKDAVVAGDPIDLKCVVVSAQRSVVISTQLAPSYERSYFLAARARMFATLRAYYGPTRHALDELRLRYGVTHVWVRRDAIQAERSRTLVRWHHNRQPYSSLVRRLLAAGEPAVLRLPSRCRRWRSGAQEVYDVSCAVARERPGNAA